ncbi:MAG: ATP-binding protein, partial [Gammaproteobacteria bacterium]|nr:ATP-binding protein [Gammaproteobacteria bacterium]
RVCCERPTPTADYQPSFHSPWLAASEGGGTGLGLAISKEIIEAHGGRIWAQNHPQEGAEFIFELPLAQEHDRSAHP